MTAASVVEPRVPLLERDGVAAEAVALYDTLLETRGVPNMFKAFANVPSLALGIAALLKPLMGEGALPGFERGPFTEKERAGFRYAGQLHAAGQAVDEAGLPQ